MIEEEKFPLSTLDESTQNIIREILQEDSIDRVRDLTALFNLNQAKKNLLRIVKLSDLQDKVTDNMVKRVEQYPGEFSNEDLLKILSTVESSIEKAQKTLGVVDETPAIQYNQQNNLSIVVGEDLDRESRDRVMNVIQKLLQESSNIDKK